ncbi:TPA: LPXTG cell wall anchor domain-containing protein, partial [Streptococcus suis]
RVPELLAINPETLAGSVVTVESTKVATATTTSASSAKLPETGEATSAIYFATALGLLGSVAMLVKKRENE